MQEFIMNYLARLNYKSIPDFLSDIGVKVLLALLIIIFWIIIRKVACGIVKKFFHSKPASKGMSPRRAGTLENLSCMIIKYVIYFIVLCQVLSQFGVSVTSILAAAGIVGLAIGFGAQSLVKDIVTGLFIIVEDQFGTGDKIEVNGINGTVESIGLRTTRIRGVEGQLHIVPNSAIGVLTNKSK